MNDAGKVAFTPKGDYSSTVTYEYLDTMVFNGNAYAALRTTTGNAPTDSGTDENWVLLARGGESVPLASETAPGVVKASSDIGASDDGSMVLKTDFTAQESLAELTSGESRKTFFGKIAKAVSTLISHVSLISSSSVRGHVKLSNSSAITVTGEYALDATEKNASVDGTLANQIGTINTNLNSVSSLVDVVRGDLNNLSAYKFVEWTDQITDGGIYIVSANDTTCKSYAKYLPYDVDGSTSDVWVIIAIKAYNDFISLVAIQSNYARGGIGFLHDGNIEWVKLHI